MVRMDRMKAQLEALQQSLADVKPYVPRPRKTWKKPNIIKRSPIVRTAPPPPPKRVRKPRPQPKPVFTPPKSRAQERRENVAGVDMTKQLNFVVLLFFMMWMRMRR